MRVSNWMIRSTICQRTMASITCTAEDVYRRFAKLRLSDELCCFAVERGNRRGGGVGGEIPENLVVTCWRLRTSKTYEISSNICPHKPHEWIKKGSSEDCLRRENGLQLSHIILIYSRCTERGFWHVFKKKKIAKSSLNCCTYIFALKQCLYIKILLMYRLGNHAALKRGNNKAATSGHIIEIRISDSKI